MNKVSVFVLVFLSIMSAGGFNTNASEYEDYFLRLKSVNTIADAVKAGYEISSITLKSSDFALSEMYDECVIYPAINSKFGRLALFIADEKGNVLYKTEDIECNYFFKGYINQPNIAIAAIAIRDINDDGLQDILIVSRCYADGIKFKIGDILFQGDDGFYRDWRISDKINRFSMNKDLDMMTAFVRDKQSAEFLYSASTLQELTNSGFVPLADQTFYADFEKFGTVRVVPGIYTMGGHHIFIIYLVNSDGSIIWNFQCMRNYDNFSTMTGISFKDVDGDGWSDLSVLAKYKFLGDDNQTYSATDFSIYYQRNGYFFEDKDFHDSFFKELTGKEVMDDIVQAARRYWGW